MKEATVKCNHDFKSSPDLKPGKYRCSKCGKITDYSEARGEMA